MPIRGKKGQFSCAKCSIGSGSRGDDIMGKPATASQGSDRSHHSQVIHYKR
jgi:hypothetical protein